MLMGNSASQTEARLYNIVQILGTITPGEKIYLADFARTIGTDIAFLKRDLEILSECSIDSYYIDIVIDGEDESFTLGRPPFSFTHSLRLNDEQMLAVSLALKMSGASEDEELSARLQEAFAERAEIDSLEQHIRITPPSHTFDVFEAVALALQLSCALSFTYTSPSKEPKVHRADVARITAERDGWYFHGFDHDYQHIRTFKLDRMSDPTILYFEKSLGKNNRGVVESTDEAVKQAIEQNAQTATLIFVSKAAFVPRDWPHANVGKQLTGAAGGGYQVDVPIINSLYVARKVVSLGGQVTVKHPQSLRDQVRELAFTLRSKSE